MFKIQLLLTNNTNVINNFKTCWKYWTVTLCFDLPTEHRDSVKQLVQKGFEDIIVTLLSKWLNSPTIQNYLFLPQDNIWARTPLYYIYTYGTW